MSSSELLSGIGGSVAYKFSKYVEARRLELLKSFMYAADMDEVSRIKGAIDELNKIEMAVKALSEK